jgi:hypothetical protein
MLYGYGYVNNHMPTLKATVMRGGSIAPSSLLTGLYAVYKGESNTNDSLATYNGTANGGVSYIAGKSGNAFDLNGTTGNVSFLNGAFNFAGDFSISMWVNYDVVKSSQMFISNLTIGGSVRGWFVESTATSLRFRGFNSGGSDAFNVLKSSYTPSTGTWIHYVFIHKNNDNRMYENGTLIASDTSNATHCAYDNPNYPMIGANKYDASTTQEPFDGKIDETNLWSKALTATEVTDLYNAGIGKFYPTF